MDSVSVAAVTKNTEKWYGTLRAPIRATWPVFTKVSVCLPIISLEGVINEASQQKVADSWK